MDDSGWLCLLSLGKQKKQGTFRQEKIEACGGHGYHVKGRSLSPLFLVLVVMKYMFQLAKY